MRSLTCRGSKGCSNIVSTRLRARVVKCRFERRPPATLLFNQRHRYRMYKCGLILEKFDKTFILIVEKVIKIFLSDVITEYY